MLNSLISYWKLDESSGTRVDWLGKYDLTQYSTITGVSGVVNNAADFDPGNSENLYNYYTSDLDVGDFNFTISAWAKLDADSNGTIVNKYTSSSEWEYQIDYVASTDSFQFSISTNNGTKTVSSAAVSTGQWYHIIAWHDANNDQMAIQINNGTPVPTSMGVNTYPVDRDARFKIGGGGGGYLNGQVDEVGYWNRLLTDAEKAAIYNNGAGLQYPFVGGPTGPTPTPSLTPTPTATQAGQSGWADSLYTYSSTQPHAVISVVRGATTDSFEYDANGNMIERTEAGVTWEQTFNAENRLSEITNTSTSETWTFVYDGDGNRVKQTYSDGTTTIVTLFLGGGLYTVKDAAGTPEVTKYYSIAGQRVAMEGTDGLQYLLTDHLGSIVAVTDANGQLVSSQRYMPFGELRPGDNLVTETDFGYTGQRSLADAGLMWRTGLWR